MPKTKWDPAEWEKKLMRMIRAQEAGVSAIFNDFINASSPALSRYNPSKTAAVWHRNTAIEAQLNRQLVDLHARLVKYFNTQTAAGWNLSNQKTDLLVSNYIKGMAIPVLVREGLFDRNLAALEEFQKRRLGDMDLSQRVWKVCEQAKENVELYLQSGIGTGRSASQLSRDVRGLLKDPDKRFRRVRDPETGKLKPSRPMANYHPGQGVYRSSFQNALRMTRTETNMAYRFSDQARWGKMDFILGYEVKLSNSHPKIDICDSMQGAYPKTFTFGGWHSNCYCYTVPILASEETFVENIVNDTPIKGHVTRIPGQAASYVSKNGAQFQNWTNQPYWLKDNFTLKDGKYVPRKSLKVVKT